MSESATIVMVNRNSRNRALLADLLLGHGYAAICLGDLPDLQQLLDEEREIDLALVDVSGFDGAVWSYLSQLHRRQIPFFVVSPRWTPAIQQACYARGGLAVLVKPLVPRDLLQLIQNVLR